MIKHGRTVCARVSVHMVLFRISIAKTVTGYDLQYTGCSVRGDDGQIPQKSPKFNLTALKACWMIRTLAFRSPIWFDRTKSRFETYSHVFHVYYFSSERISSSPSTLRLSINSIVTLFSIFSMCGLPPLRYDLRSYPVCYTYKIIFFA